MNLQWRCSLYNQCAPVFLASTTGSSCESQWRFDRLSSPRQTRVQTLKSPAWKKKEEHLFPCMLSWLFVALCVMQSHHPGVSSEVIFRCFCLFPPTCWILSLHRAQTRSCTAAPWILCHLQERDASPPGTYGLSGNSKNKLELILSSADFFFYPIAPKVWNNRGIHF